MPVLVVGGLGRLEGLGGPVIVLVVVWVGRRAPFCGELNASCTCRDGYGVAGIVELIVYTIAPAAERVAAIVAGRLVVADVECSGATISGLIYKGINGDGSRFSQPFVVVDGDFARRFPGSS